MKTETKTEWMTWGECVAEAAERGISRKLFVKLASSTRGEGKDEEFVLERRRFVNGSWKKWRRADGNSDVRARYRRSDLVKLLTE